MGGHLQVRQLDPFQMWPAPNLIRYAQEASWREDHRRIDNGRQVQAVMGLAMACRPSVDWCGYTQRAAR